MAVIPGFRRTYARLRDRLAGPESPTRSALPAGEFLHPVPLASLAVLALNDWVLKGSGIVPAALTGKLSDLAGLLFFPLLLTAVWDSALALLLPRRIDPSLRPHKLLTAIAATALVFSAVKLLPWANREAVHAMRALGLDAAIVMDWTDLFALPVLWLSWRLGRGEIARLPRGRLRWLLHRCRQGKVDLDEALADVVRCGADPEQVRDLALSIRRVASDASDDNTIACIRNLELLRDLSRRDG